MCLDHVPSHLHRNDRPAIEKFWVEEMLFWRIPDGKQLEIPFASITLADVSMNRAGHPHEEPISWKKDVLINSEPSERNPFLHFECAIAELQILPLHVDADGRVGCSFSETYQDDSTKVIDIVFQAVLLHDPLKCNYSHTMMVFIVDQNQVRFEDYRQDGSLGFEGKPKGKQKALSRARKNFRVYLAGFLLAQ